MSQSKPFVAYYNCNACGIVNRAVEIPIREEGQDVVDYMEKTVAEAIGLDHYMKNLGRCPAPTISEVKVPVHPEKGVGFPNND